jgi:hypothetical protein
MTCVANPSKSSDPILHREHTHLKNCSNAKGDFKNLKSDGPNLSFKVIILREVIVCGVYNLLNYGVLGNITIAM